MSDLVSHLRRYAREFARRAVGWQEHGRVAYSQEGEDLAIAKLLGIEGRYDTKGFYVDVGAHHPYRFSNTYYFYERGWRGVNIDPAAGMAATFNRRRPRDINLEIAVSRTASELDFIEFDDPALSGCDPLLAKDRDGTTGHHVTGHRKVKARPLAAILDENVPCEQPIDFLTVDIEGLDIDALQSNDWGKWRPRLVVAEDARVATTSEITGSAVGQFLCTVGYVPVSKLGLSIIFAESGRIDRTPLGIRVR